MTRQSGNAIDTGFLFQGNTPSGVQVENFPYSAISADTAIAATGVMLSVAVACQAGDVISNVTFKSGATAAGTPLNQIVALYDQDLALMAQSVDVTTQPWAANTAITFALATAQLCQTPGIYYVGLAIKATTIPTMLGRSVALAGASSGILATHAVLAQSHGAALTATAPATIATPTAVATVPYVVLT